MGQITGITFTGTGCLLMSRCERVSATITVVKKRSARFTRRKLAAVIRKAITSYYTEPEQREIERAAKLQGISMSSFVASAALKEARRTSQA